MIPANTPSIVENVSEGFGMAPLAVRCLESGAAPLAAATFRGRGQRVVSATPDTRYATAAIHLHQPFEVDLQLDTDPVFAGRVQPGQFVLVPPGVQPKAEVDGDWSVLHLYLPVGLVEQLNPDWRDHTGRGLWYGARDGILRLAARAAEDMASDDGAARFHADGTLRQLIARLVPALTRAPSPERLSPHALRRVLALLDARYAQGLTVAELADAAGLAESHFARAFRNSTGVTPGTAIRLRRIRAACELLARTDMPVLEISAKVGYADPGFFARVFRREHVCSPAAWRRNQRGGRVLRDCDCNPISKCQNQPLKSPR